MARPARLARPVPQFGQQAFDTSALATDDRSELIPLGNDQADAFEHDVDHLIGPSASTDPPVHFGDGTVLLDDLARNDGVLVLTNDLLALDLERFSAVLPEAGRVGAD